MVMIPANTNLPKKFPQADNRHTEFFEDHWGRGYMASVDKNGNDPIEDPKPVNWTAPQSPEWARGLLLTPGHLMKIERRVGKSPRVAIDFDKWLSEQENAEQTYRQWAINVTKKMSGGFNVTEMLQKPPQELREAIGVGPFPGVVFVQAIADGDPWALGLTEVVPAWAVALLPDLMAKARAGKLLSPTQMRKLAVEERRSLLATTAKINEPMAAQTVIATPPSPPNPPKAGSEKLTYQVFLAGWRKTGKPVSEIAGFWREYKVSGAHDPRLVAGV